MLAKIKELCAKKTISLAYLERTLEFGKLSMYAWDKSSPSVDKVIKVADFFGVSLDDLCGRSCSKIPNSSESGRNLPKFAENCPNDTEFCPNATEFRSNEEKRLLDLFRDLNEEGQEHALAVLEGLAASGIYKKRDIDKMVEA